MKSLLVFLEDPGAVTMAEPILELLEAARFPVTLLTDGYASQRLAYMAPSRIDAYTPAVELLKQLVPGALLVGTSENPDSFGLALLAAAKRDGITAMALVDAPMNAAHRFRGRGNDALAYAPDRILAADPRTAEAFRQLGFPEKAIVVCGHPAHERLAAIAIDWSPQQKRALRDSLYPQAGDRRVVLFLGELSSGFDDSEFQHSAEYSLHGTGKFRKRTDIVLEELIVALQPFTESTFLAVRPHPKNRPEEYEPHRSAVAMLADGPDGLALCQGADLVVGMTTSLLAEAHTAGCEVISVLPRRSETAWQPLVAEGRIPVLTDRTSLQHWISGWFASAPRQPTRSIQYSGPRPTAIILEEIHNACA